MRAVGLSGSSPRHPTAVTSPISELALLHGSLRSSGGSPATASTTSAPCRNPQGSAPRHLGRLEAVKWSTHIRQRVVSTGDSVSTGDCGLRGILRGLFQLSGGLLKLRGDTHRALLVLWGPL